MEIIDFKVLKYIKRKKLVKNSTLEKKFGMLCHISLDKLEKDDCIISPEYNDGIQFGFTTGDDWRITDKGLYVLKNDKMFVRITRRQKIFSYIFGFISGVATGYAVNFLIALTLR